MTELNADMEHLISRIDANTKRQNELPHVTIHYDPQEHYLISMDIKNQQQTLFYECDEQLRDNPKQFHIAIVEQRIPFVFLYRYLENDKGRYLLLFVNTEVVRGFMSLCCHRTDFIGLCIDVTNAILNSRDIWETFPKNELQYNLRRLIFAAIRTIKQDINDDRSYRSYYFAKQLLNDIDDVNFEDEKGFTPLHRVAELIKFRNTPDFMELLLEKGADPNKETYSGDSALTIVVIPGSYWDLHKQFMMLAKHPKTQIATLEKALAALFNECTPSTIRNHSCFQPLVKQIQDGNPENNIPLMLVRMLSKSTVKQDLQAADDLINLLKNINISFSTFLDVMAKSESKSWLPWLFCLVVNKKVCILGSENDTWNIFYHLAKNPELCKIPEANSLMRTALKKRFYDCTFSNQAATNDMIMRLALGAIKTAKQNNNLDYLILMLDVFMPSLHSDLDPKVQDEMNYTLYTMAEDGRDLTAVINYLKQYKQQKHFFTRNMGYRHDLLTALDVPMAEAVDDVGQKDSTPRAAAKAKHKVG